MNKKRLQCKKYLQWLMALAVVLFHGAPARAQSTSTQANQPTQDKDTTRQELAQFDRFLDSHQEIREQLRTNSSLVNDKEFLEKHPALQTYLQEHTAFRIEIRENPNAFMRQEEGFDRNERRPDNDTTRQELAQFDRFLGSHREIGEQLRKNSSLINDREFLKTHPALQAYLQEHTAFRQEIRENPNAFMRQETSYDRQEEGRETDATRRDRDAENRDTDNGRRDKDATRRDNDTARRDNDAARGDDNAHRDSDATRRDNDSARRDNDAARGDDNARQDSEATRRDDDTTRRDNDAMRRDDDNARRDNDAMHRDNDYQRRDNDSTHKELAGFDRFADSHHEIAEQLRKDPSLVNNKEFVHNHPALQAYLQEHPEIRQDMKENPSAFMHQENRFDHHEGAAYSGPSREHLASFGEFMNGHSSVAQQVSKDPSLVKNDVYVKNHPELQEYMNAHPDVQGEMKQDPQGFIKSAQQFNVKNNTQAPKTTPAPTGDTTKPKQ